MELHRLRASQVSAAQPLSIIYHPRQKLSNGFLVVLIVYAFLFVVILFVLKYLGSKNIITYNEQMFYINFNEFEQSGGAREDKSRLHRSCLV